MIVSLSLDKYVDAALADSQRLRANLAQLADDDGPVAAGAVRRGPRSDRQLPPSEERSFRSGRRDAPL